MDKKVLLPVVVALLVAGGAGLFGGMKYQQSKSPAFMAGNRMGTFRGPNGTAGMPRTGFRPVAGDIVSIDDKSLTVKLTDGSSKIIILTDLTEINEATKVDKTKLAPGTKVAVVGSENSDGSVTAQSVQLNPTLRIAQ